MNWIRDENLVTQRVAGRIKQLLKKYEINDDRIFGAMLYEGEYINLVKIMKNDETRAHDNWADVIKNMPAIWASIIKCSEMKFPFRIEFNRKLEGDETAFDNEINLSQFSTITRIFFPCRIRYC